MASLLHVLCVLPLLLYVTFAATNRSASATYSLIYKDIKSFVACYRRFNGTHEIGCTSDMSGNVGVIHYINNASSLSWLINHGPNKPYIPLIESHLFTADTVSKLRGSGKVNGMMVIHTGSSDLGSYPPHGFSGDARCPNRESSMYANDEQYSCSKTAYNPHGTGLVLEDLKMPVMLLKSQQEVETIKECYYAHNVAAGADTEPTFPLCAAELKAFMYGAGSTEICWRRNSIVRNFSPSSYCQQMGGYSSLAFLGLARAPAPRNKTIVVTARTDALSLFEFTQPGTSSPVAGMTALFAVAEAMRSVRAEIFSAGYNILFLALTGESFDYIGSQKVVYDMEKGYFPNYTHDASRMKLSDVDLIIELSQFINDLNSKEIFAHVDPKTQRNHANIKNFIDALKSEAYGVTVSSATDGLPLPPSSSQMFIREVKQGVPAVVLADYDKQFITRYYNSYLDTPEAHGFYTNRSAAYYDVVTPEAELLTDISTTISRAIYKYTTSTSKETLSARNATTTHLLYCLLVDRKCELFYTVIGTNDTALISNYSGTFHFYVSIYQYSTISQHIQLIVAQLLAYYTGDPVNMTEADCINSTKRNPYVGYWMNGPLVDGNRSHVCYLSTVQYHNASSPAFEIEDYDFRSSYYSTWTESVWGSAAFQIRIFLKPSSEVELASMVAGICLFIIAAVVSVLLQRRASVLFPPHDEHNRLITEANAPT